MTVEEVLLGLVTTLQAWLSAELKMIKRRVDGLCKHVDALTTRIKKRRARTSAAERSRRRRAQERARQRRRGK